MKVTSKHRLYYFTLGCGFSIMTLALLSLKATQDSQIEAQKIILKSSDGRPCMILDASSGSPTVKFLDKKSSVNMELIGGESPSVKMKGKDQKELIYIGLDSDQTPQVTLKDKNEIPKMLIQGGNMPAIFIKNNQNEVVATMLLLQDGGAAVGLADKEGDVSAFMRGGDSPSLGFFQKSLEPLTAIGITQKTPHILVNSPSTKDNLVLHGGNPASVLFVDQAGEVPILLSKHGLFQGKKEEAEEQSKADDKIFTLEDLYNPLKDLKLNKR